MYKTQVYSEDHTTSILWHIAKKHGGKIAIWLYSDCNTLIARVEPTPYEFVNAFRNFDIVGNYTIEVCSTKFCFGYNIRKV